MRGLAELLGQVADFVEVMTGVVILVRWIELRIRRRRRNPPRHKRD